MTTTIAYFPMAEEQATEVQTRYAHATSLPLTARLDVSQGVHIELVLIPGGEFLMGTRDDDPTHGPHQGPQHRVLFRSPFYLGTVPVTQAQWQAVMGSNPAHFRDRPDHPMETIAWEACVAFCQTVSALTRRVVRLPSEAEWEYACRAGTATTYSFGNAASMLDQYGWYRDNSGMVSQPVGVKVPNAWGLYDMHGGIDEFCQDTWHETHAGAPTDGRARVTGGDEHLRVKKGGSWYDLAEYCESAHRSPYDYNVPSEDHGMRVVVEVAERSNS